jgi:2-phospho-L-lactate guanylyltransferase (CobY/MobA/RfbA family)
MTATTEVLKSITVTSAVDLDKLAAAIEALSDTERNTTACAAAMAGADADMAAAVQADLDCIDICHALRQVLTRATADSSILRGLLEATVAACTRSAGECGRHAHHHAHCRLCSEGTLATAQACRALLEELVH